MVIWLIGISGAGKTTLAQMLKKQFDIENKPSYIIDGDVIRKFFDGDLGYSAQERKMNVKRIMLAAHILNENKIIAIVANISPFEELRDLARKKIIGYHEIWLRKDLDISVKNDIKGMYSQNIGKGHIVGKDIDFDIPLHSNLIIDVDKESEQESFKKILVYLEGVK